MIDFSQSVYSKKAKRFLSKPISEFKYFTLLDGSVRSGKTINIIYKIPQIFHEIGNNHLKIFSGFSKNTVRNNVLVELKPYIEIFHQGSLKYNASSGELDINLHGKTYNCLVVGAGDAGSDANIQGCTVDFAYANELTKHHYSFYNMLMTRLSAPNAKFIADCNPESQNHWLYKEKIKPYFEGNQDVVDTFEYWNFTMKDNHNLSPDYVKNQEKLYTGAFYDRKIMGQWKIAEGLVYDTFNEEKHTLSHKEIVNMIIAGEFIEFFLGLDYGYNHNTSASLFAVDKKGKYYLIDELYKNKIDSAQIIQWIKDKQIEYGKYFRFINADNSRPEQSQQIRSQLGIVVYEEKPKVLDSIAVIRGIVNYDRLIINRDRCKNTINEFLTYRYPTNEEIYKISPDKIDHPIKDTDDAMDSVRYGLFVYETRFRNNII